MSQESPLETALDLLVYVPVGFAVTVAEEVPKLAAKGRSRVGGQMAAARLVGRLAVAQGRKMMSGTPSAPPRPPGPPPTRPAGEAPTPSRGPSARTSPVATDTGAGATRARPSRRPRPAGASTHPGNAPGTGPEVSSLAIPGYDSLSASQVVQRLDGLAGDELEAVRRYEAAGRGRRTILARVSQLQGG